MSFSRRLSTAFALLLSALPCTAQLTDSIKLKIDSTNRTLSVSAEERVTAEPDLAILHIGFVTPLSDAKSAYASGAQASNQIIGAIKQAGIAESAIRSEGQSLESVDMKAHKFRLRQNWVVRVAPARVAEILDIAVSAGATESGEIEWTVEDEKAMEDKALDRASARARSDAEVLAKGMGVHVGPLIFVTNQISASQFPIAYGAQNFAEARAAAAPPPPLAIEPRKVSRTATVHAVFAIE